jgi:cytoskeletal protein RodZ
MSSSSKPPKAKATRTVGQILKDRREARDLSLKTVETDTRIRGKYLIAIEASDYAALPHDVYTRGFIQSYADYLGLKGRDLAARYVKERGDQAPQLTHKQARINREPILSPRVLTLASAVTVAILVLGYLFWQFSALTAPPRLTVANPDKDQVLYGSLITVNGQVGGGADVFVNDSPILSDADGNFTDAIALQDGVNAIRVTAKNRLGKTATVTRNILAHVPKTDPASALPEATFDGVAATIQIKDATTAITVNADGKEVFKGTMLPGTVQTFKAGEHLSISTTNAGATVVTLTNSLVAGKSLGALGSMGQAKNDLEFSKDTQFQ